MLTQVYVKRAHIFAAVGMTPLPEMTGVYKIHEVNMTSSVSIFIYITCAYFATILSACSIGHDFVELLYVVAELITDIS